jgi:hypothetical protein
MVLGTLVSQQCETGTIIISRSGRTGDSGYKSQVSVLDTVFLEVSLSLDPEIF